MQLQEMPNDNSNELYPPCNTNGHAPAQAQLFKVTASYYL